MKKHPPYFGVLRSLGCWVLLILTLLLKIGSPANGYYEKMESVSSPPPPPTTAIEQSSQEVFKEIKGNLRAGEGLDDSFKRQQVPDQLRQELVRSFACAIDMRRLRPESCYTIVLNENDDLRSCTYECDPLNIFQVTRKAEGYVAEKMPIALEVKTARVSGTVQTSIYAAFIDLGEVPRLIHEFANIFSSSIDFNTEPRPGDRFSLVVEKYFKDGVFVGYGRVLAARYEQEDHVWEGFWYASAATSGSHFNRRGEELGTSFLRSPIPFGKVSSEFSYHRKHPILDETRPHLGVDLAAPTGTPIMAAGSGRVIFVGWKEGFGKTVVLQHAGGYQTHYGHLSRFKPGLTSGSRIGKKDIIGYVGATGLATGPHLDYRLSCNGVFKNPFSTKFKPNSILAGQELKNFSAASNELTMQLDAPEERQILQVKNMVLEAGSTISLL